MTLITLSSFWCCDVYLHTYIICSNFSSFYLVWWGSLSFSLSIFALLPDCSRSQMRSAHPANSSWLSRFKIFIKMLSFFPLPSFPSPFFPLLSPSILLSFLPFPVFYPSSLFPRFLPYFPHLFSSLLPITLHPKFQHDNGVAWRSPSKKMLSRRQPRCDNGPLLSPSQMGGRNEPNSVIIKA